MKDLNESQCMLVSGARDGNEQCQTNSGFKGSIGISHNGKPQGTVSIEIERVCTSSNQDASGTQSSDRDSGNSRVICTYFMRKGMMDRALWQADMKYTLQFLPPTMVRGYHYWAIPYIHLMRRSALAERIMLPIARWRAEEIAYQMGTRSSGNWKGKIIRWFAEPLCLLIGHFVSQRDWESVWQENTHPNN